MMDDCVTLKKKKLKKRGWQHENKRKMNAWEAPCVAGLKYVIFPLLNIPENDIKREI